MRKLAVVGFTSFEFGAFEAFFKMVGVSRPPGYVVSSSPIDAEVVFVNGVSRASVDSVVGLPQRPEIIVVGADSFDPSFHLLNRPIRLTSALSLVNQLLAARAARAAPVQSPPQSEGFPVRSTDVSVSPIPRPAPATAAVRGLPQPSFGGLRAGGFAPAPAPVTTRAPLGASVPTFIPTPQVAPQPSAPQHDEAAEMVLSDDILVVDDSDIALRFMQDHLGAFGFAVHLARSGEECLMLLNQKPYRCVFLDVMMSGIDGYQTCRMIKQRKYSTGAAPTVIMMTSRSGAIDRVRGALAGCDGYLVKPVDESKLIKALFQHRVSTSAATSIKLKSRLSTLGP